MKVTRLDGPFGVAVSDLDLAQDMSDATMRRLIDLLHENQILIIKGQSLSEDEYARFGRYWGTPLDFVYKNQTPPEHPEIRYISNHPSTPERSRDDASHWHNDNTYRPEPASVTMLYGIEAPDKGGETLLASCALAYDALDEETKARIDDLVGLHCVCGSPKMPEEQFSFIPEIIAEHGLNKHPLVMRHPVTGRKAIYTSATAYGAEGVERDEARALIDRLRRHMTRPEFVMSYKIEAGDILLWDNFQVLHSATRIKYSDKDGERRLLYRICTQGVPKLCEVEQKDLVTQ